MTALTALFSEATGKMAAIFKHNPTDQSPTSLFDGLLFDCDSLAYITNGNLVELFDSTNPNGQRFLLDTSSFTAVNTLKKDSYGAVASKIYVGEDIYHFQYA